MRIRKYFSDTDDVYSQGAGYRQLQQILLRAYTNHQNGQPLLEERSLPFLTLCNCVRTIVETLSRKKEGTLEADRILRQLPLRRSFRNRSPETILEAEYDFYPHTRDELAAIILSVAYLFADICPEQTGCLSFIKEKARESDPDGTVAWYFLNVPAGITGYPKTAESGPVHPQPKGEIATTAQQTLCSIYLLDGLGVNFNNTDKAPWVRFLHWLTGKNPQDIKEKLYYDIDSKKTRKDLQVVMANIGELLPEVRQAIQRDIEG